MTDHLVKIYTVQCENPGKNSHELLMMCLRLWTVDQGLPVLNLSVVRVPGEKPRLLELPQVQFSVSHSGNYWSCAISDIPVGLDIQQIRHAGEKRITRRFFHPDEQAYLQSHPEAFFKVWTAKEAFVKLTGEGITGSFGEFYVAEPTALLNNLGTVRIYRPEFRTGYELCLCTASAVRIEMAQELHI